MPVAAEHDRTPAYGVPMGKVELRDVSLRLGEVDALDRVSMTVPDGRLAVVIGPSGCGKTSLLRVIAGLDAPRSGTVEIDGAPVGPPSAAGIAMMFQDDALYEHMTVGGNLTFPQLVGGVEREEARRTARDRARRVGISRLWQRRPSRLSAGERGLSAAGRALSRPETRVMLLDEPLARADRRLRIRFRAELRRIQAEAGVTMIVTTNDQEEALALADQLVVLVDGRVRQSAPPREVFEHPADATVAGFVGSPEMNLIPGRLRLAESWVVDVGSDTVVVDGNPDPSFDGTRVLVGIHPHELSEAPPGTPFSKVLHVTVSDVQDLGSRKLARVGLGTMPAGPYHVFFPEAASIGPGSRLELTWATGRMRLFVAASGETIPV